MSANQEGDTIEQKRDIFENIELGAALIGLLLLGLGMRFSEEVLFQVGIVIVAGAVGLDEVERYL